MEAIMFPRFRWSASSDDVPHSDDIFISYSRTDGEAYVTGLHAALANADFVCFSDQLGTEAGKENPVSLLQQIKRCKTFVLLGTAGAVEKPSAINQEVREFQSVNGTARIIGISFDRGGVPSDWSSASWHEYVENKHRKSEDLAALKTGEPSAVIVKHIVDACDYMKSKDRVRLERELARVQRTRIIISSLLIVGVVLIAGTAASIFAFFEFGHAAVARIEAIDARVQADAEIRDSRAAATSAAEQAQRDIAKSKSDAQLEIASANSLTQLANDRRIAAQKAARKAETSLTLANAEINQQRNLAKALSLANHAESMRDESPHQLGPSVLFAAESMRRAHTFEADQALRRGLALISKSLRLGTNVEHTYNHLNESATFSPNGRYILTMTENQVLVWDAVSAAPNPVTAIIHQKLYSFVFSPNGEYLVTGGGQQVNVWSNWWMSVPKLEASLIHSQDVRDVIVSPKSKFLATSDAKHVVHVWENWNTSRAREVASTSGVTRPSAPVRVVFSDDETRFAAQLNHRSVGVFSSISGLMIGKELTGHLIANRKFFISVTDNNELQVSTPTGERIVGRVRGFDAEKLMRYQSYGLMDYSDATHVLALESESGTLAINVVDNHVITQLDDPNDIVDTVSLSPDGNLLAVTNYRSRVTKIWRIAENTRREELRLDPEERASKAIFSPDGQRIVTIGSKSVRIWTTNAYKQDLAFDVEGDVTAIAVSPDERYIAASVASRVFIIDVVTGKIAPPFDVGERAGGYDSALIFSKNGEYLAFSYANGTYIIAD